MDCGPATLKCLLEGFRIPISYGRLREACQTDVDGTSIDTLEAIAPQLGVAAEQVLIPGPVPGARRARVNLPHDDLPTQVRRSTRIAFPIRPHGLR